MNSSNPYNQNRKMVYCTNCGKQIDEKAIICVHCGAQQRELEVAKKKDSDNIPFFFWWFKW